MSKGATVDNSQVKRTRLSASETEDILRCIPVSKQVNGYSLRFQISDFGQAQVAVDHFGNNKDIYLPPEILKSRTGTIEVKTLNLVVEYERNI